MSLEMTKELSWSNFSKVVNVFCLLFFKIKCVQIYRVFLMLHDGQTSKSYLWPELECSKGSRFRPSNFLQIVSGTDRLQGQTFQ